MILSDGSLRRALASGRIVVEPLADDAIQPASIDIRVDRFFRAFVNHRYPFIDPMVDQPDLTELIDVGDDGPFILHPGEFVLGSTVERIALPADLVASLDGKSSLGRLGLLIHQTAGVLDSGFDGHLTLELSNVATLPIAIHPGMKIGQVTFFELDAPAELPYGAPGRPSKYQGQRGPTPSRYHLNYAPPPEHAT